MKTLLNTTGRTKMVTKEGILVIRAQDIQRGIGKTSVPYDFLLKIGSGATLSLYIRGLGFLPYKQVKDFAYECLDIQYSVFDEIIHILEEIKFVEVVKKGGEKYINPKIPYFEDLYNEIGNYAKEMNKFDEREQITLEIVNRLSLAPCYKEKLLGLTDDKRLIEWIISLGKEASYIDTAKEEIVYSPIYFMEQPQNLNELLGRYREEVIAETIKKVREKEGLPIDLLDTIEKNPRIRNMIKALLSKKILQPYCIEGKLFTFTPIYSTDRIQIIDRKLYEKAVALVSAVRYGQHFAQWKIASPSILLQSLKIKGYIRPNTHAKLQYGRPELTGVIHLKDVGNGYHETHLIDNPDNRKIVDIALQLLGYGEIFQDRGVDEKLKLSLAKGQFKDILPSYKVTESVSIDKESRRKVENMLIFGVK